MATRTISQHVSEIQDWIDETMEDRGEDLDYDMVVADTFSAYQATVGLTTKEATAIRSRLGL